MKKERKQEPVGASAVTILKLGQDVPLSKEAPKDSSTLLNQVTFVLTACHKHTREQASKKLGPL